VIQHNPSFRPKSHNNVPPPANLNQPSTPRGRGRGRGGGPRGPRGTASRG
jgi:5'-3' exoribonuclease 1